MSSGFISPEIDIIVLCAGLSALVALVLLALVIRKKKRNLLENALALVLAFQFLWSLLDGLGNLLAIQFGILNFFAGSLNGLSIIGLAIALYFFAEAYPGLAFSSGMRVRQIVLLGSALPVAILVFTPYWIKFRRVIGGLKINHPGDFYLVFAAWVALAAAFSLWTLIQKGRRMRHLQKQNVRILLAGYLMGFSGTFLFSVILPLRGIPDYDFFSPLVTLLFCALPSYAVLLHEDYNIERTLLNAVFQFFLILIIALLAGGLIYLLFGQVERSAWYGLLIAFLGGILSDALLRPWFEKIILRRRDALRLLAGLLSGQAFDLTQSGMNDMLHDLRYFILQNIPAPWALFSLRDSTTSCSHHGDTQNPKIIALAENTLEKLSLRKLNDPFSHYLNRVIILDSELSSRGLERFQTLARHRRLQLFLYSSLKEMQEQDVALLMPLIAGNEMIGFFLLGRHGRPYYHDDLKLLQTMQTSIALAIRNHMHARDLNQMKNIALEQVEKLSSYISSGTNRKEIVTGRSLVYKSRLMQQAIQSSDNCISSGMHPVLISGETGTGKELIARYIHMRQFSGKPFVAINCAAIPEALWEDEIFGHVEGAFTDARRSRKGKIEEALGGTLFFDEIGEMPLAMQAKMLRLLEERAYARIGSNQLNTVKCRFIYFFCPFLRYQRQRLTALLC